jgi:competence protein ComEC
MAKQKHIPIVKLYRGQILNIDPAIAMFVLAPEREITTSNVNVHSIVIKVVYGKTSILLTGDAEKQSEIRMDRIFGHFLDADLLKVGHHGSNTSSSANFLALVTPKIAAVSVGLHNRYHLPDLSAIKRVLRTKAKIHFTSFEHALIFQSDGKRIIEQKWN